MTLIEEATAHLQVLFQGRSEYRKQSLRHLAQEYLARSIQTVNVSGPRAQKVFNGGCRYWIGFGTNIFVRATMIFLKGVHDRYGDHPTPSLLVSLRAFISLSENWSGWSAPSFLSSQRGRCPGSNGPGVKKSVRGAWSCEWDRSGRRKVRVPALFNQMNFSNMDSDVLRIPKFYLSTSFAWWCDRNRVVCSVCAKLGRQDKTSQLVGCSRDCSPHSDTTGIIDILQEPQEVLPNLNL